MRRALGLGLVRLGRRRMDALLGATGALDAASDDPRLERARAPAPPAGSRSAAARAGPSRRPGPAILTSASQAIEVPSPASDSVKDVVMSMSAPDARPLRAHRRELGLALLEPLEVHRHVEAAEAERDLDLGRPVLLVVHLEALHAGHELRHLGGIVDDCPDRRRAAPRAPSSRRRSLRLHRDVRARRLRDPGASTRPYAAGCSSCRRSPSRPRRARPGSPRRCSGSRRLRPPPCPSRRAARPAKATPSRRS